MPACPYGGYLTVTKKKVHHHDHRYVTGFHLDSAKGKIMSDLKGESTNLPLLPPFICGGAFGGVEYRRSGYHTCLPGAPIKAQPVPLRRALIYDVGFSHADLMNARMVR